MNIGKSNTSVTFQPTKHLSSLSEIQGVRLFAQLAILLRHAHFYRSFAPVPGLCRCPPLCHEHCAWGLNAQFPPRYGSCEYVVVMLSTTRISHTDWKGFAPTAVTIKEQRSNPQYQHLLWPFQGLGCDKGLTCSRSVLRSAVLTV